MFSSFFSCSSYSRKKNTTTNREQNLETKKVEVDPQVLYFNGDPFGSGNKTKLSLWSDNNNIYFQNNSRGKEVKEEEEEVVRGVEIIIMKEVFEVIVAMKNAYVSLQEAHSPWDPEKLRAADLAVVAELRKLGGLRERYLRRRCYGSGDKLLMELVAPYEAAVVELRREVKARDMEVVQLKEKLKSIVSATNNGKKLRMSRRKVYCSPVAVLESPAQELFENTMNLVREASQSFTSILLSHMRAAQWDIAAAVRSIEAATTTATMISTSSVIKTQHANAKYALESYISRKIFLGFDHESFYMDGSTSSLLNPEKYRQDCFNQYNDLKNMDALELLDILPMCNFGKFCSNKYLAIVHPKMEASLFGDLEQRRYVVEGSHPRSQFYKEFLKLGKAVWLLHLLAFSVDPAPSLFEASRGAQFHPQYMESVVKFPGGRVPSDQVVGFPMSPGFKLGNGSIIKAEVYPVSKN
ncbi:protein GRAVITROPIC IN THE LIGHT 1-like [Argentina anserina]|uniref:protein GRAVITROPIC IN THE LIGHT 1-like n=1 Tax=Argentina anserina TaxID=57926 RepID=UPI0021762A95|nr:protein GRAVITROPIC IN THE LIGHT 1-like [Potentilla anserina]